MISKEQFTLIIENLRQQYLQDKEYVEGFVSFMGGVDIPMYNNGLLVNSIIDMLRVWFPLEDDGFCAISHYCYDCEFGKVGDICDVDGLWDYLVGKVNPIDRKA